MSGDPAIGIVSTASTAGTAERYADTGPAGNVIDAAPRMAWSSELAPAREAEPDLSEGLTEALTA